jgi:hypothetical protein
MGVSEAQKLKTLEDENRRLKKLLAESMLDVAALKDLLGKNWLVEVDFTTVRREPERGEGKCASGCGSWRRQDAALAVAGWASCLSARASV